MNKKIIWTVVFLAVIALIGFNYDFKKEEVGSLVKIGVLSPLTGNFASLGEDFSNGIRVAAKENKNILILEEDTASDPKVAISAMNRLLTEGVKIFIGGPSSSVNLALVPVAEQNKVTFLAYSKTSKLDGAGEYIFRAFPVVDKEADMMAEYVRSRGIKRAAIIFETSSDTSIAGKNSFSKKFESLGGEITAAEGFDSKTIKDFRTIVLKVKDSNPEGVYLMLSNEANSAEIIKQMKQIGLNAPIFGWSIHDTERMVQLTGETSEGFTFTAEPFSCNKDAITIKYCSSYALEAGERIPQYYGAYAYDMVNVLSDLLEKNNGNIEETRSKLAKLQNQRGVMGTVSTDPQGNVVKNDFIFKTFRDGKIVNLAR